MAYGDTFHPAGTARDIKIRGPLWVGVFSVLTIGIYAIFWFYFTVKDLSEYGKAKGYDLGQNPVNSLLAILFGWILLAIPSIIAIYRFFKRIQQAQRLAGAPDQLNGWLTLVLLLVFSPAAYAYGQSELNKAWAAEGGPVDQKDEMPQQLNTAPTGGTASTSGEREPEPLGAPESPERPPGQ